MYIYWAHMYTDIFKPTYMYYIYLDILYICTFIRHKVLAIHRIFLTTQVTTKYIQCPTTFFLKNSYNVYVLLLGS